MKNILYIGPYRENNGLGRSSRRYINSLATTNCNICIRPVFYSSLVIGDISYHFKELESNTCGQYDCIIQHGYADMFCFNDRFGKHIGIVEIETENLTHTGWIDKMNLMDEIIVGNSFGEKSLIDSGLNTKIKILPEPYNVEKITSDIRSDFFEEPTSDFIFYTIGRYTEKNNIKNIILAYLMEFDYKDNVRLVIKTNKYDTSAQILETVITTDIRNIQTAIRKNSKSSPKINVLTGEISDESIVKLHQSGNCYINTVRSDGNAASSIEALLNSNPVITTTNIGACDYINENNGYLVESVKTSVYSTEISPSRSCSIWEFWYDPIVASMREQMREAYTNHDIMIYDFDKAQFSHKMIGSKIYE